MRSVLISLMLLFCASFGWALPATLAVTVNDGDLGTPLQGVRLSVRGIEGTFQTDADGKCMLPLTPAGQVLLITAVLPGYETKKTVVQQDQQSIVINLLLAGVVQGGELVVEHPKPNSTDAQAGVSEVATKNQIEDTTMGVFSDVMSTVKTLPGVSYTSPYNARPSIQGGNPNELIAVLDGAYVLYPYHWGGAVSIFSPDMVDSVKLSDGIVSADYGQFLSGVLEVTTISPNQYQPTVDVSLSATEGDLFVSAPIGNNAGLLVGGKQTWLQVPLALFNLSQFSPFITEGYSKLFWDPTPSVKTFLDVYAGTDGVTDNNSTFTKPQPPNTLTTTGSLSYANTEFLIASGVKLLLDKDLLLNLLVNYNSLDQDASFQSVTNGTKEFDQSFINNNSSALDGATSFTLDDLTTSGDFSRVDYLYQAKADLDWQIAEGQLLSFGAESTLRNNTTDNSFNGWETVFTGSIPAFDNVISNVATNGDNTVTSAVYGDYNFSLWSGLVTGEAGVRANYTVVYNNSMTLLTVPAVDPRIRIDWTPIKNSGGLKSFSVVGGTGLFSEFPIDDPYIDKAYGAQDWQISPTRAWFNELGIEAVTADGLTFDLDGYFKWYYDRFYTIANMSATPVSYASYNDGYGYAYGVDAYLEKQTRYWEGWISNTFVITRLYNPEQAGTTDTAGDPTGIWYYPSYSVINTVSFVLTLKPTNGFSFTTDAQIASGSPLQQLGPVTAYLALMPGGQYIERYAQTSSYSDTLRSGWSFPIDVKASWHGFYHNSKVSWEFFVAVQDILAPLYAAGANGSPNFDPWYGQTLSGTASADFNVGVPIPTVGYRITY